MKFKTLGICCDNGKTLIYVDGELLEHTQFIKFEAIAGKLPQLTINTYIIDHDSDKTGPKVMKSAIVEWY